LPNKNILSQQSLLYGAILLQVNPAGIFPTLGEKGAYWAVFFKLSMPQSLLRGLGLIGSFVLLSTIRASFSGAMVDSYLASYQVI